MKKIVSAILAAIVICFSGVPVFAASPIPHEAELRAASTGEEIVKLEEGVYAVGDAIFIDVNVHQSEYAGEQNGNMYGTEETPEYVHTAVPYGATIPSSRSVWDWAEGDYFGDFEFEYRVYTNYRFTGYSSYTATVNLDRSPHVLNDGAFYIKLVTQNGLHKNAYHFNEWYGEVTYTGIKPADKISICIGKAKDDCIVKGNITVSPGE